VNEARAFFGLSPIDNLERQVGWAERILLATSPAFDFRADFLPSKVRYIGPLLEEPTWAKLERNIEVPGPSRPSILVAFSSTFQGQLGTIQNVATALGQLPVTGLITLGPALVGAKLRLPPNVIAVDCASHEDIMARATVVVTHGGHGTVIRALAHRVPLLCLPMGRDQHDNAIRVTERGAGLTLDRDSSPDCIRHALTQLIEDERFARAAQAFACRLTDKSDVADLVGEIEALALSWQGRVALERSACGVRARKKEASL
jgi:UDP:flavonoid glycosyltransferase YjiC (YdhE family)